MPEALTDYVKNCPTCQRVMADHLPPGPAGPLFPVPVTLPSRRGGGISLDFLELPVARSGHDFLRRMAGPDIKDGYYRPSGS